MQFPYIDLGDYDGPRDGSPPHIEAIYNRPHQPHDAHVDAWEDHLMGLEMQADEETRREIEEEEDRLRHLWDRANSRVPFGAVLPTWLEP